ncbi:MAG: hypothetical protein M3Z02_08870 [Actinomycetota bacterium]|nr:hypothetical protein [Actinomycetota bacterium]
MLVISGALVLVALVLLIIGIVSSGILLVYMCIGVAIVAFICLLVSVLQTRGSAPRSLAFLVRRRQGEAGKQATSSDDDDTPAPVPSPAARARHSREEPPEPPQETEPAAITDAARASGGDVLVVPGRPRYHLSGCRYLAGKGGESRPVEAARTEGYSPCGVCKPDETLAERYLREHDAEGVVARAGDQGDGQAGRADSKPAAAAVHESAQPVDGAQPAAENASEARSTAAEPARSTVSAPAKPASSEPSITRTAEAPTTRLRRVDAPIEDAAKTAPAKTAPARSAPAKSAPAKSAPAKTAPAKSAPAKSAPAKSAPARGGVVTLARGHVLVIPDRSKFHRGDCRFVKGNADAVDVTRTVARRQGYEECGVCNP